MIASFAFEPGGTSSQKACGVAGETPELTGNQARFLIRRGLLDGDRNLAFPILGRWLHEYAD